MRKWNPNCVLLVVLKKVIIYETMIYITSKFSFLHTSHVIINQQATKIKEQQTNERKYELTTRITHTSRLTKN